MAKQNNRKTRTPFSRVGKIPKLVLAGLISGSMTGHVFAQAASGEAVIMPAAVMVSETAVSPVVHAVLTESTVSDAQAYPVSAAISPVAYAVVSDRSLRAAHRPTADSGTDEETVMGNDKDDAFQLPYALVLALFALIGLVPVSRRNH